MRVISLQSGSNGNCVFVEAQGTRLLFDAGISGIQMQTRLAATGVEAAEIDGLLISHDHSDHVRCMGVYQRKYGIPVYVTHPTLEAARRWNNLGRMTDVRFFESGSRLRFGKVTVETIPTPHDSQDGVVFVVDDGRRRLGILTDLGHVFPGLADVLRSLDAVLLESNYDPHLLASGPYPEFLKRRIRGPGGHLSNEEAAGLLDDAFRSRLQWACLAHLSEQNNEPNLALRTHRQVVGDGVPVHVASRYCATAVLEV